MRRCKRMADRFVVRNWGTILIGLIMTLMVSKNLGYQRGYVAYGGEWLIIPMLLAIKMIVFTITGCLVEDYESARDDNTKPEKNHKR